MIEFLHPEAWLLAPIVVVALGRRLIDRPLVTTVRIALLLALLGAVAEPYQRDADTEGHDLVIVADRSRSMPDDTDTHLTEILRLAAEQRTERDRIGLVTFAATASVAQPLVATSIPPSLPARVPDGAHATDLFGALESALALIPPHRSGSILLIGDGTFTGRDPRPLASLAQRRGVRIDTIRHALAGGDSVGIERIAMPHDVHADELFEFHVFVHSATRQRARVRVLAAGRVLTTVVRELTPGLNQLEFRDARPTAGLHHYRVEIDVPTDSRPANNSARSVVRVRDEDRVLYVTEVEARVPPLLRLLRQDPDLERGFAIDVRKPDTLGRSLGAFEPYRVVVLDNVPRSSLHRRTADALTSFVDDLGGGLLMIGGPTSFGTGGYRGSAIEDLLPVSLEVRDEQRKFALAMGIALDRSGSMRVSAGTGTKMELACRAAADALRNLGPADHATVLAVDTAAEVIVPPSSLTDIESIATQVEAIPPGGGGIYVEVALRATCEQLKTTPQERRHIILFSDARDSELPGEYRSYLPEILGDQTTLSVIGLGKETDPHADLLRDLAAVGHGRCLFADNAADLNHLFTQEAIVAADSAVVRKPVDLRVLPPLSGLGDSTLSPGRFAHPRVGAYSMTWPKPEAEVGIETVDELGLPALAFWQHGLGRTAAYTPWLDPAHLEAAESFTLPDPGLFAATLRWLAGEPNTALFADARLQGTEAVVTAEVATELAGKTDRLRGYRLTSTGKQPISFRVVGPGRLEARLPMPPKDALRCVVELDGLVSTTPPLVLPYSPEYRPQLNRDAAERTFRSLSATTIGTLDPLTDSWFDPMQRSTGIRYWTPMFAWTALGLLLLEIAIRRLDLRMRRRRRPVPIETMVESAEPDDGPSQDDRLATALTRAKARARRRQ